MSFLSRREFAVVGAGGVLVVPGAIAQTPTVTASGVVDRIRANIGVDWKADTVDTFKVGDPSTAVKGIVVTTMATMDVLKKAVAAGANFVITSEPTFYSKADNPNPPPGRGQAANAPPDAVLTAKKDFIQKNGLVVWRFSDHWRLRTPDPLAAGISNSMAWDKYRATGDATHFELPSTTLAALAANLKLKLGVRGGMRVVGDPKTEIKKVALLTGTTALAASVKTLPGVDAIVAGEVREWESVEYAQDAVTAGLKRGMILLGRVVSEEPGMKLCADWLHTIVHEAPVTFIGTGDPYWRPA